MGGQTSRKAAGKNGAAPQAPSDEARRGNRSRESVDQVTRVRFSSTSRIRASESPRCGERAFGSSQSVAKPALAK